ncbi:MAG: EAL domain-containing protein [Rhodoferax sp.]|nr:EAL domain-containing protein [Rhodoferax sp.]
MKNPEVRRSAMVAPTIGMGQANAHWMGLALLSFSLLLAGYVALGSPGSIGNLAEDPSHPWTQWLLVALVIVTSCVASGVIHRQRQLLLIIKASDNEKQRLILQLESEKHRASVQASQDHLTSLPNRRMFYELGATYVARAKRSRGKFALLYVDLDRFKVVNDTLGHHVGDLLLQTVAARLTSALRESDVVARLGGDEFAILLPDVNGVEDIALIAQKIIDLVSRLCTNLHGNDIQISPSVGIAVFPRDGHNVETMARNADAAMYQSKRSGRGRFTFYDASLNATNVRTFDLEQQLPRAIAYDELVLYFQPKVRLEDFRIVGFEALVRWMHPEHGMIQPGEFIPMAENTGLDVPLGDWVLHECCRQLSLWQASGIPLVPIAVNVSARQLHDESLPRRVQSYLQSFDVRPGLLQVEITEGSLVDSFEVAAKVLLAIEKLGVSIALDDFGNGYSSFGYIRTLPIHVIKIDRSFIDDIRNRPSDAVIVASIVTLAHNLNKKVVAEGVEMIEQVVHLKTVGCDEVQGYLLSRPVSADAAAQLLADDYLVPQV